MRPDQGRSEHSFAPPRWVYRAPWTLYRAGCAISGGRLGRRGAEGQAVVASNAGTAQATAWWSNLQAQPLATVDLRGGSERVRARVAHRHERAASGARSIERLADDTRYAATGEREVPVAILEPSAKEAHA